MRGDIVLSYQETGAKQLESITTPENNTLTYAYNGGLLLSETISGEVSGSVSFGYDNNFRANSITVNDSTINYTYDNDGSLATAGDLTLTKSTENGMLEGTTLGDISTAFTYSNFGEMDSFTAKNIDTEYFKTLYTRDKLGRITQKTETIEGTTNTYVYKYDVAGRLDTVFKDTVKISDYKYDSNGNRLTANDNPLALLSSYDDQDRLLYEPVSDTTYAYNAHGDLETKTDSEGKTSYNYDELGNLISVTLPSSAVIDYTIDGRNRRVAKKVDGVVAYRFIYQDQLNPIAKVDADGNLIERYVYGSKGNIPDYIIRDGEKYSIVSDHLGSPRLVVKVSDGSVVQKINYSEFGVMTNKFTALGFDKIPFGFAGGIYDVHTGFIRLGTRDLDAIVSRWTNKDYIRFDGKTGNLYEYVNNDPINFVDFDGKARIGRRPLNMKYLPFNGRGQLYHEHIWYDDGTNSGFMGKDEKINKEKIFTIKDYDFTHDTIIYDDDILKQAEKNVKKTWNLDYDLVKNNCQHYMDAVRAEYNTIILDNYIKNNPIPEAILQ